MRYSGCPICWNTVLERRQRNVIPYQIASHSHGGVRIFPASIAIPVFSLTLGVRSCRPVPF